MVNEGCFGMTFSKLSIIQYDEEIGGHVDIILQVYLLCAPRNAPEILS